MTRSLTLAHMDAYEVPYAQNDYRGISHGDRPDALVVKTFGNVPILFSTPHTTKQLRLNGDTKEREIKEEDAATGGLAEALAQELQATSLSIVNQAGDPNTDKKDHPYKVKIGELAQRNIRVVFDLHGMGNGTADKVKGRLGVGLGAFPSAASGFMAQALKTRGLEYGIKVKVGNSAFAAISDNNVTTTAQREFGLYAIQLELAPELRFGEGNDETRLAAFKLIVSVAQSICEQLPLLDQLSVAACANALVLST